MIVSTTKKICSNKNTEIYETDEYDYNDLFQSNTFIETNKCVDLGKSPRTKYLKILNENNIKCSGIWCINGNFEWNANKQCYEVEHIVDRHNTPYDACNTNILGNVVMAYASWNNQIGQLCWDDAKNEKIQIYGKEIFCKAVKNIIECSNCNAPLPIECNPDQTINKTTQKESNEQLIYIIVIATLAVIFVTIVICIIFNNKNCTKTNMRAKFCNNYKPPADLLI